MSLGTILLIVIVIALLGGFSGLGGRLVDSFARQLDGQVERVSSNKGTIVSLTLPLREAS